MTEKQKAFKPYTVKQPSRLKRIYQKLPGVVWTFWIVLIALWIAYPDGYYVWGLLAFWIGIPAIINGLHVNSMSGAEYRRYLEQRERHMNNSVAEQMTQDEESGIAPFYEPGGIINMDK